MQELIQTTFTRSMTAHQTRVAVGIIFFTNNVIKSKFLEYFWCSIEPTHDELVEAITKLAGKIVINVDFDYIYLDFILEDVLTVHDMAIVMLAPDQGARRVFLSAVQPNVLFLHKH